MALYVWFGEEPDVVYIANQRRIRARTRDAFHAELDEHWRYAWQSLQLKIDGKWRQGL